jgi:hypothetical protein
LIHHRAFLPQPQIDPFLLSSRIANCDNAAKVMGIAIVEQKGTEVKTVNSVAVILERELDSTIQEWLKQVNLLPDLTNIPLNDSDRTGHLPQLFDDLVCCLRLPRDAQPPVSIAAAAHGGQRFAQGYSPFMLVEESRIFQVTTFGTLHLYQSELDQSQVLLDVMIIADEADRQLTETVRSFMTAQEAAATAA